MSEDEDNENGIAIIGMSGRFPGSDSLEEFWESLKKGKELITRFTDDELRAEGISDELLSSSQYVKARGILNDPFGFDAHFFEYLPAQAVLMDPQHRILLECAWEALESSGYDAEKYEGSIGAYMSQGGETYFRHYIASNPEILGEYDEIQLAIANWHDFLATRLSHKLNLTGPSLTIQTACSSSLVAIHYACKDLMDYDCDIALAGGVSLQFPHKKGYLYQEGMIFSSDGHCRAFDIAANGTVPSNGAGIIVLKRLDEALDDNDTVLAVIKGSAVNNDGSNKAGYTAPSVHGQVAVLADAYERAEVPLESISYIETHGTGTKLGDPIELRALKKFFASSYESNQTFCALGSLKSNTGHLDMASGVASVIKTVLALQNNMIPPSLHFNQLNPEISLNDSPFFVNTKAIPWISTDAPRRAGVSNFGFGGTNAHLVLEEAPVQEGIPSARTHHFLPFCAKNDVALEDATENLVIFLEKQIESNIPANLADIAHTLQVGRRHFAHRRFVIGSDKADIASALKELDTADLCSRVLEDKTNTSVVFMFSGQGSQYVNMAKGLYETIKVFREVVNSCSDILYGIINYDIRQTLFPYINEQAHRELLKKTHITQPVLFIIEYALAKLWESYGVVPTAMIGHSIGEYIAACLAGVFTLEEGLKIVAARGSLMESVDPGAMLAVSLPEKEIIPLLGESLDLAAVNVASQSVVSGTFDEIDRFQAILEAKGVECRRVQTSHAFHSRMMDGILDEYLSVIQQIHLKSPSIPFISNVTGKWIRESEAIDPAYWVKHIRKTVRFADGIEILLQNSFSVFLEIGPGKTLASFVKRHNESADKVVFSSTRHQNQNESDVHFFLQTFGQLWLHGVSVDFSGFYSGETRYRVPLPTYPFQREQYCLELPGKLDVSLDRKLKKQDIDKWTYVLSWKRLSSLQIPDLSTPLTWLIFSDDYGLSPEIIGILRDLGHVVIHVYDAEKMDGDSEENSYFLSEKQKEYFSSLVIWLKDTDTIPNQIIYLRSFTYEFDQSILEREQEATDRCFYQLLYLVQALGSNDITSEIKLTVVSNGIFSVYGDERLSPEKSVVMGPCQVIPQEYANISCNLIDIGEEEENMTNHILSECLADTPHIVAYRCSKRWVSTYEQVPLKSETGMNRLREKGVYLITGGLGGIGLTFAKYLAESVHARLVLVSRRNFPEKSDWSEWVSNHDENDEISQKITQIVSLEKLGSEVLILQGDVADIDSMQIVVDKVVIQFGGINGVIHAAGIAGDGIIQLKTKSAAREVLDVKVKGTLALDSLLKKYEIDFMVLCSSLASVLSVAGQVDYVAANNFLDAFAQSKQNSGNPYVVSINWDAWSDVGMAADMHVSDKHDLEMMTPDDGVHILQKVLANREVQVLVSTTDLIQRQQVLTQNMIETNIEKTKTIQDRSGIQGDFIAPSTETEKIMVNIWQKSLGIAPIGIHDNFLDLGGDSLLVTQVVSRIRTEIRVEIPLDAFLKNPTIAACAAVIYGADKKEAKIQAVSRDAYEEEDDD